MRNTKIQMKLTELPLVLVADQMHAAKPFLHADRIVSFHVLIYVLRGRISVVEDANEYEIESGRLLLLKAGIRHYGVTYSEPNTEWIYVHFRLKQSEEHAEGFRLYSSHLQEQEFKPEDYEYVLELPKLLNVHAGSVIEGKLHHLVELFHSSNPLRAGYMNPLFYEILMDTYLAIQNEEHFQKPEKIYVLIQYLEGHTHENYDADKLEAQFHMSAKHLGRIFKASTGRTLTEYHTELRMNEAARLLRETTDSVQTISGIMGYQDPFYFSNVFHKWMKYYPRAYRQQYFSRQ